MNGNVRNRLTLLRATLVVIAGVFGLMIAASGSQASALNRHGIAARRHSNLTISDTPYTWGRFGSNGTHGTRGGEGGESPPVDKPTAIQGLPDTATIKQLVTSNSTTYALLSDGSVWAWGWGTNGQLGNGDEINSFSTPVRVNFPGGVVISSLAGTDPYDGALALDPAGDVFAWGFNAKGDLCVGGQSVVATPVELSFTNISLATGAGDHALYYDHENNQLYGCGDNANGELGTGNFQSTSRPVSVVDLPKGDSVTALVSAWSDSGVIESNGTYWDWGFNQDDQLGNDSQVDSDVPVDVNLPNQVEKVALGGSNATNGQTFAILSNGNIWAWGNDTYGQLGNDTEEASSDPILITPPSATTWVEMATGGGTSLAIDSNGNLWSFGRNNNGQTCDGSRGASQVTPIEVVGLSGVSQVSSTADNVAAVADNASGSPVNLRRLRK